MKRFSAFLTSARYPVQIFSITENLLVVPYPDDESQVGKVSVLVKELNSRYGGNFLVWHFAGALDRDVCALFDDKVRVDTPIDADSPLLEPLFAAAYAIHNWLQCDRHNVAVILDSRNGDDRAGALVSVAYLLYSAVAQNWVDAACLYAVRRWSKASDQVLYNDTVFSSTHKRYLTYVDALVCKRDTTASTLRLHRLVLTPVPAIVHGGVFLRVCVAVGGQTVFVSDSLKRQLPRFWQAIDGSIVLSLDVELVGDVSVRLFSMSLPQESNAFLESTLIARYTFHTAFLPRGAGVIRLPKAALECACTDPRFDDSFCIDLVVTLPADQDIDHEDHTPAVDQPEAGSCGPEALVCEIDVSLPTSTVGDEPASPTELVPFSPDDISEGWQAVEVDMPVQPLVPVASTGLSLAAILDSAPPRVRRKHQSTPPELSTAVPTAPSADVASASPGRRRRAVLRPSWSVNLPTATQDLRYTLSEYSVKGHVKMMGAGLLFRPGTSAAGAGESKASASTLQSEIALQLASPPWVVSVPWPDLKECRVVTVDVDWGLQLEWVDHESPASLTCSGLSKEVAQALHESIQTWLSLAAAGSQKPTETTVSASSSPAHRLAVAGSESPLLIPSLSDSSVVLDSSSAELLSSALLGTLRLQDWELAYSSAKHGMSLHTFFRLTHECGPSLLVIRDTKNHIFGCFSATSWKKDSNYYGRGESFVFTLSPCFKVYRWSGKNTFFVSSDRSGIRIGGGKHSALSIASDLAAGSSGPCETYNSPVLASGEQFEIVYLEVWSFES